MTTARATVLRENNVPTTSAHITMILIVELAPARDASFRRFLAARPHRYVKLVESGAAALHLVKHIKPNLFLLTYRLPDMDGLTLYELLHETEGLASIPAIIVGTPLPTQALAIINTQRLVLLSTFIGLEELVCEMTRRN